MPKSSRAKPRRKGRRGTSARGDEWPATFVRVLGAWNEDIERPRPPGIASAQLRESADTDMTTDEILALTRK